MTIALGHKSLAQAKAWISPREFAGWKEYYKVEPFGEQRNDLRIAVLICYMVNQFLRPKTAWQTDQILPFIDIDPPATPKQAEYNRGVALERKFSHFAMLHNLKYAQDMAKGVA